MSEAREELLRLVRDAEQPTAEDEERVLGALHGAIAAGQITPVSERVEASLGAQGALTTPVTLLGLKSMGLVLALLSAAALGLLLRSEPESSPSPAAPAAKLEPAQPAVRLPQAEPAPVPDREDAGHASQARSAADAGDTAFRARRSARPARPSAQARTASADDGEALQAELSLLKRVQAALRRSDGAAALAELDAYTSGAGALRAEREAARILALCLLGRADAAQAAAVRFALDHPASPQRAAIDGSCANSRRNGAP